MTMYHLLLLTAGAGILCIAAAWIISNTDFFRTFTRQAVFSFGIVCGCIFLCAAASFAYTGYKGYKQGAEWSNFKHMPWEEYVKTIDVHPDVQMDLSEIKPPCLILYNRFGCGDCNMVLPELMKDLQNITIPVHYVSTRTECGKALLEQYPVTQVPMLVYLDEKENAFYLDPIKITGITAEYDREQVLQFLKTTD